MTRFEDALKLGYVVEERSGRRRAFMMFECEPVVVGNSMSFDRPWHLWDKDTGKHLGQSVFGRSVPHTYKDVRRILKPNSPGHVMDVVRGDEHTCPMYTVVWEAGPEPKELTVSEVAELLGYPVKIVEG